MNLVYYPKLKKVTRERFITEVSIRINWRNKRRRYAGGTNYTRMLKAEKLREKLLSGYTPSINELRGWFGKNSIFINFKET
jgi:hypothetical protein